jgi:hypothetical protein
MDIGRPRAAVLDERMSQVPALVGEDRIGVDDK